MAEKTDEDFLQVMQMFPSRVDKSSKEYSDRNLKINEWESILKLMGILVEDCKKWWERLLKEYRDEKKYLESVGRSGSSGALKKRESFALYYIMKDMLMTSETDRPHYSNYNPSTSTDVTQQHNSSRTLSNEEKTGYNFTTASGRSRKKAMQLKTVVNDINETIGLAKNMSKDRNESAGSNDPPNQIIGSIVKKELENMDFEKSSIKRKQLTKLLMEYDSTRY